MAQSRREKYEKEQASFRRKYPQLQDPPAAATMRRWRQRAYARGITPEDWEKALHSSGEFAEIAEQVRDLEKAHARWKKAGGYWGYRDVNPPTAPEEWGKTWGWYH